MWSRLFLHLFLHVVVRDADWLNNQLLLVPSWNSSKTTLFQLLNVVCYVDLKITWRAVLCTDNSHASDVKFERIRQVLQILSWDWNFIIIIIIIIIIVANKLFKVKNCYRGTQQHWRTGALYSILRETCALARKLFWHFISWFLYWSTECWTLEHVDQTVRMLTANWEVMYTGIGAVLSGRRGKLTSTHTFWVSIAPLTVLGLSQKWACLRLQQG